MPRYYILVALAFALSLFGSLPQVQAQVTPPIMPKVTETPLPPAVELPAPPSVPAEVPNRPLTAEEAARIALHFQPSVSIARAGITAAQGRQQQARSDLLPSVSAGAGYTDDLVGTPSGIGYQFSAGVRQLLFDFNHTRSLVRQAAEQERAANANLSKVQSDLVLQVKQAFYQYAQNQRLAAVNEATLRNRQDHLALAKARVQAGVGLPIDVVRAETAVAEAIFALNFARNTASVSRVSLALLMGIDPRTPVQTAETDEPPMSADDVEGLVKQALQQRPEVMQAQANIQAARHGVNAAKTGNAPALVGSVDWGQRGVSFPPGDDAVTAEVAVQWDPFDGGFTAGRVKEAKANLVTAQQQLTAANLTVISDVSQAYLNLKTAEQRVITADAQVANAEEALRLAQGRYQAGLGVFLDVLDAQTALSNAQSNRVNARSAVNQARAALARAISSGLPAPLTGK
ncbi:MAG: TolC family protein [Armatimonadota bacterium]